LPGVTKRVLSEFRDIAAEGDLPEKFLELILLELKNARIVESIRGAKGGYRLHRAPSEIQLSQIVRSRPSEMRISCGI
jgi:Rrf2 family protein